VDEADISILAISLSTGSSPLSFLLFFFCFLLLCSVFFFLSCLPCNTFVYVVNGMTVVQVAGLVMTQSPAAGTALVVVNEKLRAKGKGSLSLSSLSLCIIYLLPLFCFPFVS